MQEKQRELIRLLRQHTRPVPGPALARQLGVSTRTVQNYVRSLNAGEKRPIIHSSPEGYLLDQDAARTLLSRLPAELPQTYRERSAYIIQRFLIDNAPSLNLYDLCDELSISYSLLKNDIQKMNASYAYLHVRFYCRSNELLLGGKERDFRRLLNHMIQETKQKDFVDIDVLKNYFPEENVQKIFSIISDVYREASCHLNDFAASNLLLHLLIMVNRLHRKETPADSVSPHTTVLFPKDLGNGTHTRIVQAIRQRIESAFSVSIGAEDFLQLGLLVRSSFTHLSETSIEQLESALGSRFLCTVQQIIQAVERKYLLMLGTDHFITTFSLHLKNLTLRVSNNSQIVNPIKDDLRESSPFLYDVAIYIIQLMKETGLISGKVSEDEISFLVLHLYAEIERQTENEKYLRCLLLVPDYLNAADQLSQKLLARFSDQITLTSLSAMEDLPSPSRYDFLVTTLNGPFSTPREVVHVSPMMTARDYLAVGRAIDRAQNRRSLKYLTENFSYYFSAENFLVDTCAVRSGEEVICLLSSLLNRNGYVDSDFARRVMQREAAISTAYRGFAIPHAADMNATCNAIAVLISQGGVPWNGNTVHIVFLMAISPDMLIDFQIFYQTLALLLTETSIIDTLQNCRSFEQFKDTLLDPRFIESIR